MKDFFIVAKFTAKEMVKRKSFIISTIIILAIIIIGFNIPNIINSVKKDKSSSDVESILIIDHENIYGEKIDVFEKQVGENIIQITHESLTTEQIQKQIDESRIKAAIIVSKENESVKMEYVVNSLGYFRKQ